MVPIGPSLSQTPSTSSATLWATPSKEWIIPAKPKPGRKPKKESSSTVGGKDDEDDESSGRRVQNRAAQRAFRERRQSQLAELQARLHSYEQGEIERNVALQNVAKKMKEENEQLRKENNMLRERIACLELQLEGKVEHDKKRVWDDTSAESHNVSLAESERKKARVEKDARHPPVGDHSSVMLPSFDEGIGSAGLSPTSALSPQFPTPTPPINDMLAYSGSSDSSSAFDSPSTMNFRCGLCNLDTSCVCRENAVQQTANNTLTGTSDQGLLSNKFGQRPALTPVDHPVPSLRTPPSTSILDNLPAYQAPVPLRRKPRGSSTDPVFSVTPLSSSISTLKCSGDPSDCMACAEDTFGREFCRAISHSVASSAPCSDCPRRSSQSDNILVGDCCGDVDNCASCGIAPNISSTNPSRSSETMPTDEAWRQLKSHPNVAFADLTLLAEVVARRSKCMGPRVVISPALGSITPERSALQDQEIVDNSQSVLLRDPHGPFHQKQVERCSPPRLVPQDVLIECGRRRMREVNADGVREALRLLDSKFAHARP